VQGGAIGRVARPDDPSIHRMLKVLTRFVHRSFSRGQNRLRKRA
jgi:hypothetical protein